MPHEENAERPKPLPKPALEPLPEDPEEEMQNGSRLGIVKPMEFGQNKPVEEKPKPPIAPPSPPKKHTFDIQIQTMPEPVKVFANVQYICSVF